MSTDLMIVLSVVEVVLLVAVLGVFLLAIAKTLRSIAHNLGVLESDLQGVDRQVGAIAPTAAQINAPLNDIVGALPEMAGRAEHLAGMK